MSRINFIYLLPDDAMFYGKDLLIIYGMAESPVGRCFMASCHHGICYLGFPDENELPLLLEQLCKTWPKAVFHEDCSAIKRIAQAAFPAKKIPPSINLLLKGTPFQIKVWQALLDIPPGRVANYADIAQVVGMPKAVRAVGTAIGKNPVSYLVPCHRVVPKGGGTGNYLWGSDFKARLLAEEKLMVAGKKQA